jgi:hypothetical protein
VRRLFGKILSPPLLEPVLAARQRTARREALFGSLLATRATVSKTANSTSVVLANLGGRLKSIECAGFIPQIPLGQIERLKQPSNSPFPSASCPLPSAFSFSLLPPALCLLPLAISTVCFNFAQHTHLRERGYSFRKITLRRASLVLP